MMKMLSQNRHALSRLLASVLRDVRMTFWNPSGFRRLRRDVATAPNAVAGSMAARGFEAGASLFYRLPGWVMTPLLGAAWIVQATRARRREG